MRAGIVNSESSPLQDLLYSHSGKPPPHIRCFGVKLRDRNLLVHFRRQMSSARSRIECWAFAEDREMWCRVGWGYRNASYKMRDGHAPPALQRGLKWITEWLIAEMKSICPAAVRFILENLTCRLRLWCLVSGRKRSWQCTSLEVMLYYEVSLYQTICIKYTGTMTLLPQVKSRCCEFIYLSTSLTSCFPPQFPSVSSLPVGPHNDPNRLRVAQGHPGGYHGTAGIWTGSSG